MAEKVRCEQNSGSFMSISPRIVLQAMICEPQGAGNPLKMGEKHLSRGESEQKWDFKVRCGWKKCQNRPQVYEKQCFANPRERENCSKWMKNILSGVKSEQKCEFWVRCGWKNDNYTSKSPTSVLQTMICGPHENKMAEISSQNKMKPYSLQFTRNSN